MKWLTRGGILLLGVLAMVAAVAAVGVALPDAHRATSYVELDAAPGAVFERMSNIEASAVWRPSVERIEMLDPTDNRRFREYGPSGPLTMELVEISDTGRMVTRIADPDLPFGGTWSWSVEPAGRRTRVTIREDGVIHNPIFRTLSRYVFGYNATMETYLRELAASFGESGAVVVSSTE